MAVDKFRILQREDMRVLQPRRNSDLVAKVLQSLQRDQVGMRNFQRHPYPFDRIAGLVDQGKGALPQPALDLVFAQFLTCL